MIDRLRLLAEMLLQRLQFALHVIDRAVDLPTSRAFVKRLEQFGERLALDGNQFQRDQEGDQAGVGKPVIAEVEMAGMFATKDSVQSPHLGLDVGVSHTRAYCISAHFLDQFRHALRDNQVIQNS